LGWPFSLLASSDEKGPIKHLNSSHAERFPWNITAMVGTSFKARQNRMALTLAVARVVQWICGFIGCLRCFSTVLFHQSNKMNSEWTLYHSVFDSSSVHCNDWKHVRCS
jgi:hypothetical protein